MPSPAPPTVEKIVRRHAHDVRNHCCGIDLDATLLSELSDDPEITAMAGRLKKQVARIELDLKLLLLKMEEPRLVTLTVGDLLQLWRLKLQPLAGAGDVTWPEFGAEPSITVDSRLTIQALCDLTLRIWDRHPGASLAVTLRQEPEHVMLELIQPPHAMQPPADFLEEMAAVLSVGGLQLDATQDPDKGSWVITLGIPLSSAACS